MGVEGTGDQRDRHVLTHPFPTRRYSDLLGLHRKPEQRWAAGDALDGCNAALPFDFLGDEEGFIGMLTFSENKDAFGGFDHARSNERRMRVLAFGHQQLRSEEHTSELQSLMRISYAVFCLKKNNANKKELTQLSIYYNR